MPGTAHAQKQGEAAGPVHDPVFSGEFYAPYEEASLAALAMLCTVREEMACDVLALRYRLKSAASIREKLQRKGLPETAEAAVAALRDVAGLRAVLTNRQAVYRFARLIVERSGAHLDDVHDYIAAPKKSGYQSLHLILQIPIRHDVPIFTVPVEIQLRTAAMDAWASEEHRLIYKPRT